MRTQDPQPDASASGAPAADSPFAARLASFFRQRIVLAWLAGASVWLAWAISLALGGWRHDASGHRLGADHVEFFVVGTLVNEGTPGLIYDAATMQVREKEVGGSGWQGYLPFRYPPFYALAFTFTSRLDYEASFLLWTALGLACLVGSGLLLGVGWRGWLIGSLCFYPVFATVSFGQNSLISLFVISATAALWLGDRPFRAGLVAGLLLFKPPLTLGIGLLWLCDLRHSWRALLGATVTGTALALLAWLAIPEACRAYLEALRAGLPTSEDVMALPPLYSSQAFWQLLLPGAGWLCRPLSLVTSVVGLWAFVLWWRGAMAPGDTVLSRKRRAAAFGLAVLMTGWLSPYLMVYDWSILLVPAVLLGRVLPRDRWLVLAALVWLAAFLTAPLVRGQLAFAPIALQLSMPALVVAFWLASNAAERQGGIP